MNMGIQTAGGQDQSFAGNNLRSGANDKIFIHTIHHGRISGLADAADFSVFYPHIRFNNSPVIHNDRTRNDCIRTLVIRNETRLSHTVTQRFSAAELGLFAIYRIVLLYLDDQRRICQTYPVTGCRSVHIGIFRSADFIHFLSPP